MLYESPERVGALLADLERVCGGERALAVARELTKLHESFFRGTIAEAARYYAREGARGEVVVKATLKKNDDTGVSGVPIAFRRVTLYGSIDLGSVKTDNSGTATLTLNTLPDSGREVDADFKGNSRFGSSAGKIMLQPQVVELASASGNSNPYGVRLSLEDVPLLPPEGSLITPNPPLVPTAIFASVVLCVWATYAYVVSQVVGIWRSKPSRGREDRFSRQSR